MFLLGLSRVGRRHCARVAAAQRRRSVVTIAASLSSVSKLAPQDFVNFLCGNPRWCDGAALGLLRSCCCAACPSSLAVPCKGARKTHATVSLWQRCSAFSRLVKLYVPCSVLPSLHDALDACFSQNFQVLFLSAPLNDASRWSIFFLKKKKNRRIPLLAVPRSLLEGAHFPCPEVPFRVPLRGPPSFKLHEWSAQHFRLCFLQRRTCHVGAVALGNHTALENLPLPPRL